MSLNDSAVISLLQCFFMQCERHFRFLEEKHGFRYLSGLAEYRENYKIIKPYSGEPVVHDFLAVTRYEKGDQAIELTYGDENFFLDGYVYFDPVQRFSCSEVLSVARGDDFAYSGAMGVIDKAMLSSGLERMGQEMREYIELLISPSCEFVEQVAEIRHKRVEASVRKHFQAQIEESCNMASRAFLAKDYVQVVSLLSPLEMFLEEADLKKLKLARKHLLA